MSCGSHDWRLSQPCDHILFFVDQWRPAHGDGDDEGIKAETITGANDAIPSLRKRRDLTLEFVDQGDHRGLDDQWRTLVASGHDAELQGPIDAQGLRPDETSAFVDRAFRDQPRSTCTPDDATRS